MQITVTARNMEITNALKDYVEARVGKLTKYSDSPIEAHVILSTEKYRHLAEINLLGRKMDIHGEEETADMYLSVDRVVEKVERQLRRHKERGIALKGRQRAKELNNQQRRFAAGEGAEQVIRPFIVKTHRFPSKPMSVDEAVMQMDALGKEFFVFNNSETDDVNVIYKRKDGNFGLIEPAYEDSEVE